MLLARARHGTDSADKNRRPSRPIAWRDRAHVMNLQLELQLRPLADEVSALVAVVRPILKGVLYALRQDIVAEAGGYEGVKLKLLSRLYRPGDGDCGICFEYAVHDAVVRREPAVLERVTDVLSRFCKVPGASTDSILFGAEKSGALQLIETARDRLTEESMLLYGTAGRPVKLKRHIDSIARALHNPRVRPDLPDSIRGIWKADLFLGKGDSDRWVGTTVKINEDHLEGARGLRIGIVPARQGRSDAPRKDDLRNLVICPLSYDGSFMEIFYRGWGVVKQFIAADAQVPKEVFLPVPADRQVARLLAERREFPVLDVIEALEPLAQPQLLQTDHRSAQVIDASVTRSDIRMVVAPSPKLR
jgi:hypothetical protein